MRKLKNQLWRTWCRAMMKGGKAFVIGFTFAFALMQIRRKADFDWLLGTTLIVYFILIIVMSVITMILGLMSDCKPLAIKRTVNLLIPGLFTVD